MLASLAVAIMAASAVAQSASDTPVRRLVGAKVIVRMHGTDPSPDLLSRVRKGKVGGVILFPDNIASRRQVRALSRSLQRTSRAGGGDGVVVAVDQEGGPVKRLSGPPDRSPAQIAASGSSSVARGEGAATGRYLASLGIGVDFAPVLDVPKRGSFIASRAFGSTPGRVSRLGGAFADGLARGGATATLKHFPGLGRATANTDNGTSVVSAPRSALRRDMAPFAAAIQRGAGMVMMSTATYSAFGSGPAALNPAIVTGELRQRLGFGGVIVTDDLEGGAVRNVMPPAQAAVAASKAGADMVLLATSPQSGAAAYSRLYAAAKSGQLDRGQLEESYARIRELQQSAP